MKRLSHTLCCYVFVLPMLAPVLLYGASAVYVDQGSDFTITSDQGGPGLDAGDTITWNQGLSNEVSGLIYETTAFTSVQAAVDAVDAAGTLYIAAGVFDEGAEIIVGKDLHIRGEGRGETFLSGGSNGDGVTAPEEHRVLIISQVDQFELSDLAIVDGRTDGDIGVIYPGAGAGVLSLESQVTLTRVTVSGNSAVNGATAGGIDSRGLLTIVDCDFLNNSGDLGGAIYSEWLVEVQESVFTGNFARVQGGAICAPRESFSVSISDSVFSGNASGAVVGFNFDVGQGGALYADCEFIEITNTSFLENASLLEGGALCLFSRDGGLTISGSDFSGNSTAERVGGAMFVYCDDSVASISDTTVSGNEAYEEGGGIYFTGRSNDEIAVDLTLRGLSITGNSAQAGGGIFVDGGVLHCIDSTLRGNFAESDGGGAYLEEGDLTFVNATVWDNSAEYDGGGVYVDEGDLTFINATLSSNNAGSYGGGLEIKSSSGSAIVLHHTTVSANVASSGAGLDLDSDNYSLVLNNSIVAGNLPTEDYPDVYGDFVSVGVNFIGDLAGSTVITGAAPMTFLSTGTTINQLLAPLGDYGGPTLTHNLYSNSVAVDAGSNATMPAGVTTDQRGDARIANGTVDLGAIEFTPLPAPTIVSSIPVLNTLDLHRENTVTLTFDQDVFMGAGAIELRSFDDHSVVASEVSLAGEEVSITANASLLGGSRYYVMIEATALTGLDAGFAGITNASLLSFIVPHEMVYVDAADDFVITSDQGAAGLDVGDRLTWQGAHASVEDLIYGFSAFTQIQTAIDRVRDGGIIYIADGTYQEGVELVVDRPVSLQGDGAGLTLLSGSDSSRVVHVTAPSGAAVALRSLAIIDGLTTGSEDGAGLYSADCDLTLEAVLVSGNNSADNGGGIYIDDGSSTFSSVRISGNTSSDDGAGIYLRRDQHTWSRVTISDNESTTDSGGGIYIHSATLTLEAGAVSGNVVNQDGAGIYNDQDGDLSLFNVTISDNSASRGNGGGIYNGDDANSELYHVTITGNVVGGFDDGGGVYNEDEGDVELTHVIIAGNEGRSPDYSGELRQQGPSFIGDTSGLDRFGGFGLLTFSPTETIEDLLETTLADNGGSMLTHRLVDGSPAIDAGDNEDAPVGLVTDQRGYERFVGESVDLGALEYRMGQQLSLDTDGDGSPTAIEIALGTDLNVPDPNHPNHLIEPSFNLDGDAVLSFGRGAEAGADFVWILERSMTLEPDSFVELFRFNGLTAVETTVEDVSATVTPSGFTVFDEDPPEKAFYRVKVLPSE